MSVVRGVEGADEFGQRHRSDNDGGGADAGGHDEGAGVDERAAGVDDVRHVAVLLVGRRAEQRLAEVAEDPGRVRDRA